MVLELIVCFDLFLSIKSLPVPTNKKENDYLQSLMNDCICLGMLNLFQQKIVCPHYDLGIIRDKTNPYKWSHAYTKENIKFESWSNSIDLTKPAACMGDNGNWHLENHCIPICVEPLPQVLSPVFTWIEVRKN